MKLILEIEYDTENSDKYIQNNILANIRTSLAQAYIRQEIDKPSIKIIEEEK